MVYDDHGHIIYMLIITIVYDYICMLFVYMFYY